MDRAQLLNDQETAIRYGMDNNQSRIWTAMPAIVTKVTLGQMTIECQPAVKGLVTDENEVSSFVNLPQLVDVPLCFPSAGGFTLTFPIAIGDEVLIIIAKNCIDSWWQSGGVQQPAELRMHDLSDGFAIPGPRSLPRVVTGISSVNAQLRKDDGTTYVEITPGGKVRLVAPAGVEMVGDLKVTGDINATGEVTAKILGTPIPLSIHLHPGVTTGSGDTGAPIP